MPNSANGRHQVGQSVPDDRDRLLAALQDSEAERRFLPELAPLIMWFAEPDGRVAYVNQRWNDYTGLTVEQAVDWGWLTRLHPDDREPSDRAWREALANGDDYKIEHRLKGKDGSFRWILSQAVPLRDASGQIVRWFGTASDIDELKQTQWRLEEANALLKAQAAEKAANEVIAAEHRERRRLAAALHDDLVQTLILCKMKLEMLGPVANPEVSKIITEINASLGGAITAARTLMSDLKPPMLDEVGLSAAVMRLIARLEEQQGFKVEFQTDGETEVHGELRSFLFDAVRELLVNAAKYSRTHKATVSIIKSSTTVFVTVEDRGVGFDPKKLKPVPTESGGFGLFHIRERLLLLGGRLDIDSNEGKGTTVTICVPLPDGAAADAGR